MGSPVRVADLAVSDIRTLRLRLDERPVSHTPGGRAPIAVHHLVLTWDLASGYLYGAEVFGYSPADTPSMGMRRRRVEPQHMPDWLRDLAEYYAPDRYTAPPPEPSVPQPEHPAGGTPCPS